jgi:hypothetical protein
MPCGATSTDTRTTPPETASASEHAENSSKSVSSFQGKVPFWKVRACTHKSRLFGNRWPRRRRQREAALLTSACRPAIAYSRVGTGRTLSAVPSSSNFPASHLGSKLGLIAPSYRAFSSLPLGRPTRLPDQALFCRRRHQPSRPPPAIVVALIVLNIGVHRQVAVVDGG